VIEVALITYPALPDLSASDQLLLEPLAEYGIQPVALCWDSPDVDWPRFDAVILRSCWDYPQRAEAFRQWIIRLLEMNVPLHNSPRTVLWNMQKHYLHELEQHGTRIIPTVWVTSSSRPSLREFLETHHWEQAVLKPTIGASGKGVQIVTRENVEQDQLRLDTLLTIGDAMLQPVVEEIRDGELSLVFFQGDFSYAIRKMPGSDSIFVNSAYGGSRIPADVSPQVVKVAQFILETAMRLTGSQPPLYARVDGVMVEGEFVLMELELIEPGLLMDIAPSHAASHFARVIAEAIGKDR
jgi:glutathione synthase/RimK-type ligase-like ATP-grasp enzyme